MTKCEYCANDAITVWGRMRIAVCQMCFTVLRNKYWKMTGVWLND